MISKEGVKADTNKVKAILEMKSPSDVKSLKSFLGVINYLSKFLPNLSKETKILRDLEKKGI